MADQPKTGPTPAAHDAAKQTDKTIPDATPTVAPAVVAMPSTEPKKS